MVVLERFTWLMVSTINIIIDRHARDKKDSKQAIRNVLKIFLSLDLFAKTIEK